MFALLMVESLGSVASVSLVKMVFKLIAFVVVALVEVEAGLDWLSSYSRGTDNTGNAYSSGLDSTTVLMGLGLFLSIIRFLEHLGISHRNRRATGFRTMDFICQFAMTGFILYSATNQSLVHVVGLCLTASFLSQVSRLL